MSFNHLRNLANPLVWESVQPKGSLKLSSFWLNQPLWKICKRQIGFHFPKQLGVKIPKILGKPPLLIMVCSMVVLLMEEILHHLGCLKTLVNTVMGKTTYQPRAGLLPSTVCHKSTCSNPLVFGRRQNLGFPRVWASQDVRRTRYFDHLAKDADSQDQSHEPQPSNIAILQQSPTLQFLLQPGFSKCHTHTTRI